MKRLTKIFVLCFFLCSIVSTFSACSEKVVFPNTSITLGMALTQDGKMTQELGFSFQSQKLKELGIGNTKIEEIKNNMIASINALRNEFYITYLVKYSSSPNQEYKIGESLIISDAFYSEESDMVMFVIVYKNFATWQFYNSSKKPDDIVDEKPTSVANYITKTSSTSSFPFSANWTKQNGEKITVGERYLSIYKSVYNLTLPNNICSKLETPKFVYDYATPFSNIKSNAEMVIRNNGLYHNVWIKNQENYKDAQISLSTTEINYGLWYLTLFLAVIGLFAICLIILKLKDWHKSIKK